MVNVITRLAEGILIDRGTHGAEGRRAVLHGNATHGVDRETAHILVEIIFEVDHTEEVLGLILDITRIRRLCIKVVGKRHVTAISPVRVEDGIGIVRSLVHGQQQIAVACPGTAGLVPFIEACQQRHRSREIAGDMHIHLRVHRITLRCQLGAVAVVEILEHTVLGIETCADEELGEIVTARHVHIIILRSGAVAGNLVKPVYIGIKHRVAPVEVCVIIVLVILR